MPTDSEYSKSNRLELHDPEDWEAPSLTTEEDELLWEEEFFQEQEMVRKVDLYGPKPGRWETEWS